jgi:hypothetical protein
MRSHRTQQGRRFETPELHPLGSAVAIGDPGSSSRPPRTNSERVGQRAAYARFRQAKQQRGVLRRETLGRRPTGRLRCRDLCSRPRRGRASAGRRSAPPHSASVRASGACRPCGPRGAGRGLLARDSGLVGVRRVRDGDHARRRSWGSRRSCLSLLAAIPTTQPLHLAHVEVAQRSGGEVDRSARCGPTFGAKVVTRRLAMVFNRGRPTRSGDRWVGHAGRPGRGVRAPRRSPLRRLGAHGR